MSMTIYGIYNVLEYQEFYINQVVIALVQGHEILFRVF